MNCATKIKMILAAKDMNMKDLALLLNTSQPNLSMKMKREKFDEKELEEIAKVLNVNMDIIFTLENGTKI